jgi:hypothetical protein
MSDPSRTAREVVVRTARRLWAGWLKVAHVIGTFQARVMLSAFYFVVVPVFAILVKVLRDPLSLGTVQAATFWIERRPQPHDSAWRQY